MEHYRDVLRSSHIACHPEEKQMLQFAHAGTKKKHPNRNDTVNMHSERETNPEKPTWLLVFFRMNNADWLRLKATCETRYCSRLL